MAKNIQFIGLQIPTQPIADKNTFKSLSNEADDSNKRIELLKKSLEEIYEHPSIERNTVKMLVLPQLFFRGKNGAYTLKTVLGEKEPETEDAFGLLQELQEIFMDKKWKRWVLNFGTIIGYSTQESLSENDEEEGEEEEEETTEEEKASTDDSLEELLRKAQHNEELKNPDKKKKDYQQAEVNDSLESLLEKATHNREIDEEEEGEEEEAPEETEAEETEVLELSDGESEEEEQDSEEDNEAEESVEIKDVFQLSIIINGGFGNLKRAKQSTTLVVTPYKSDIEFSLENDDELKMVVDIDEDQGGYLLEEECSLDHWELVKGNGEVDQEKLKDFQKNKKQDHLAELHKKLRDFSGKKDTIPAIISPLGLFEVADTIVALDTGLEHMYQVTKKTMQALTDRKNKINLKKLFPKEALLALKYGIKKGADIHIVSSYGVELHQKAILSREEGYVVNAIPLTDKEPMEIYSVTNSFLNEDEDVAMERILNEEIQEVVVKGEEFDNIAELFSIPEDKKSISFYIFKEVRV